MLEDLISSIEKLKLSLTSDQDSFIQIEKYIVEGMKNFGTFLDEYGDLYFEKEYVRLQLSRDNIKIAVDIATSYGFLKIPRFPVLFARYYERKSNYKTSAYFYSMQEKLSFSSDQEKEFKRLSQKNYDDWISKTS